MKKYKIGIIGCGNISTTYIPNIANLFKIAEVYACSDVDIGRAKETAEKNNIPIYGTVDDLLQNKDIDIILNLTPPGNHFEISEKVLSANKHLYLEKPLSIELDEGKRLIEIAEEKGLLIGCAPDTFLGAGIQTCRKLIDDGWIGRPFSAVAFFGSLGPEYWHPNPGFFYKRGAGPLFDMGPYYITALVSLLGDIKRVSGSAINTTPQRMVLSKENYGKIINVEVPTQINATLEFESGANSTLISSFDVLSSTLPYIEIYGTGGTLNVPNPNFFDGPVKIKRKDQTEWYEVPLTHSYKDNVRGLGLCDMLYAIEEKRSPRASGKMAYHVLEVMHKILKASETGIYQSIQSRCGRPDALPVDIKY